MLCRPFQWNEGESCNLIRTKGLTIFFFFKIAVYSSSVVNLVALKGSFFILSVIFLFLVRFIWIRGVLFVEKYGALLLS